QLFAVPVAAVQGQEAEPAHIVCIYEHPAAPVATAAHGLYRLAVEDDPGIAITIPPPGIGGADRVHNICLQDLWQRLAPDAGRSQCQCVYADIVVFPDGSRGIPGARLPFFRFTGGAVGPVWFSP